MEVSLSESGTSSPTGELATPFWSTLQSTIGLGPKSDTLWLGKTGSWGLLGRGGKFLERGLSWFPKVRTIWETEQAGIIEQGSEKRREVCFAWSKSRWGREGAMGVMEGGRSSWKTWFVAEYHGSFWGLYLRERLQMALTMACSHLGVPGTWRASTTVKGLEAESGGESDGVGVFSLEVSPCTGMLLPEAQGPKRGQVVLFYFVIILVKVMNTRENLHIVLGGAYSGVELSFLCTVSFPSQR